MAKTPKKKLKSVLCGSGKTSPGAFEEEEKGIGITSVVVKVQGEDLATPGCLREVSVRWCVGDWVRSPLVRS